LIEPTVAGRILTAVDSGTGHDAVAGHVTVEGLKGWPTGAIEELTARLRREARQRWLLIASLEHVVAVRKMRADAR
jgi:hypothetical protein